MKIKLTLNPPALESLMPFVSKDETRFVLNGIVLECEPGKPVVMAATDGRSLGAIYSEDEHDAKELVRIIIPMPFLKLISGVRQNSGSILTHDTDTHETIAEVNEMKFTFTSIKGNYPKWTEVIPKDLDANAATTIGRMCFNPKWIMKCLTFIASNSRFNEGAEFFGVDKQPITMKTRTALAILMPMRTPEPATLAPFVQP